MITTTKHKFCDKYVISFTNKNLSNSKNVTYNLLVIVLVLAVASYGAFSINSKAISPNPDTVFFRINTTIKSIELSFWNQSISFLRQKKNKIKRCKCYIVVDETYESYTGKLLKKEKKHNDKLTRDEKEILKYLHKYQVKRGDTGSYKYLVFALVYGNKRRVLAIKALKRKEKYKTFIVKKLMEIRNEVEYECVLFDRGFYDGEFIEKLQKSNIPFIVRAKISDTMKKIFGFYIEWKNYKNFKVGTTETNSDLILGIDYTQSKRTKWAFITNINFDNKKDVRELYRKRWNIENIFKATDGIQLKAQTSNPTTRMFCVCLSFLFYNAWQDTQKRQEITLDNFIMKSMELILEAILKAEEKIAKFYRDKIKLNLPFWDKIISSQ